MVTLQKKRPQRGNSLLSHALAFAAGLIIHSLVSREDCGDVVLKEISKNKSKNSPASTALRPPQPLTQSLSDVSGVKLVSGGWVGETETKELNFYDIGLETGTDKVQGQKNLHLCLKEGKMCNEPKHVREECQPFGHFYHTLYQQKLGSYSHKDAEPFQFLEVGFFNGNGYDMYRKFLPRGECHSIEISCLPHGDKNDGKTWPWGNFAEKNPKYQQYLDENLLHCGDANDVNYLMDVWTKEMKRPGAPPLKVVVDDGSHEAAHMAQSVLFWLPRIEPGGFLFVEDIQPSSVANAFTTQFLPQIMKDLHYCGDKDKPTEDEACFPTLVGMVQSIHCEMHICVIERNQAPAKELSLEESKLPTNGLDLKKCKSMLPGHW
mmetsp:Transcript_10244/g.16929  ORF Transcript_10244/g.16929 Transcript_10244/m.16929 type:complete len:377 (+) Transcript_10244:131-1261(+)